MRTQHTVATDLSHFKKASPEALAIMMRNIKNNKGSKDWVPGGGRDGSQPRKDEAMNKTKRLFY